MLRKQIYPKIESKLNQAASELAKQGFTPNQLTLAGLVFNLLAGLIFAYGHFFLAALVLLLAGLGDMLDGPLARVTKKSSKFGAFLDSTADRYSDFFLMGGLCLYYARNNAAGWVVITLGILAGSFVTSYTKARIEGLGGECHVGVLERAERVIIIALGALLPFLMPLALWVLLIGTHFTAIERIIHANRILNSGKKTDGSE